jgi:hypothetical protein
VGFRRENHKDQKKEAMNIQEFCRKLMAEEFQGAIQATLIARFFTADGSVRALQKEW